MIDSLAHDVRTCLATDRETLRNELEATRTAFHHILDKVSADRWTQESPSSAWTVAEVFCHLTWAVEYLPKEVAMARQGRGMFNFPKQLADPVSYWFTRLTARKSSPESIRHRYDAAIDAAIKALETVPDSDWERGARFYGEGFYTVADLFKAPAHHLAEHTAGL